jgi:hypothetical protein
MQDLRQCPAGKLLHVRSHVTSASRVIRTHVSQEDGYRILVRPALENSTPETGHNQFSPHIVFSGWSPCCSCCLSSAQRRAKRPSAHVVHTSSDWTMNDLLAGLVCRGPISRHPPHPNSRSSRLSVAFNQLSYIFCPTPICTFLKNQKHSSQTRTRGSRTIRTGTPPCPITTAPWRPPNRASLREPRPF